MRKWVYSFCLILIAAVMFGCGSATSVPTTTVSSTAVTFSGAAAASSTDLAKLGASALAVESNEAKQQNIANLKAKGFDEKSISALGLKPLAIAGTTVTLNKVSADGSYTVVDTENIGADGTYKLTDEAYSASNMYVIKIKKEAAAVGNELDMETLVDAKASTAEATAILEAINSSPQTTLLMEIIKNKIVEALGTSQIDADVAKLVKTLVIAQINYLVTSEGLTLSTVKKITESENLNLKNAAVKSFSDSVVQKAIYAIKFNAAFNKGAADLPTAKQVVKEVFIFITGSPTGVPENIVNAFAQSYVDGVTKTVAQVAEASDKCVTVNGAPVTGNITAAKIAEKLKSKIAATYQTATAAGIGAKATYEIKAQNPIVQAVFPAAEWAGKDVDGSTALNVPQILIMVEVGCELAAEKGGVFNGPKAAMEMGLMAGLTDKFEIMHSEIRIESFEDWQNFQPTTEADRPPVNAVLTSFLDVGNMVNSAASTAKLTATLTYQKADGSIATANYLKLSGNIGPKSIKANSLKAAKVASQGQMGPPPGFVNFQIMPWGSSSEAIKITDFKKGSTATIRIYDNGVLVNSKDVAISGVDLSSAVIQFKTPYPNVFESQNALISVFQTGTKPVCEWTFGTVKSGGIKASAIDFGALKSAYAIEIRTVNPDTNMPDFSSSARYSSWHKQDFIEGKENEACSFTIPAVLTEGIYSLQGAVIGIDNTGWPVVSGPWRSTLFKVGAATDIQSKIITIEGTVTPPSSLQTGKTIKVGLFKMEWNMDFMNSSLTPVYIVTPSNNAYSMTINYSDLIAKGNGGYDTIAWEDDGNGKIDGALDERPLFPSKHLGYFNGMLNAMDQNFQPLGPVTSTQNKTGYNIDMSIEMWKPE